jgi:RNA polymerase sigma factor (sigma-70 family)
MHDLPAEDADLLRHYATGSEAAFRELVRRHLGMVHGTARRILAMAPHLADDVTQTVFTDLAKKSPSLPAGVVLGGWLHRHTCYLALNAARAEHRRRTRERTAMEINALNENPGPDAPWAQLAPVLDAALNQLEPADRDALVLRYLEQRDLRSVGRALGSSEDAAQKRVSRALEKLRGLLVRSGMTVGSAAALGTTLEASPAAIVTPEWATTISDLALSGAAAVSILTLILTSLKTMITSKLVQGLAAVVALVGITIAILTHRAPASSSASPTANVSASAAKPITTLLAANQVEPPKVAPAKPAAPLPDAATPPPAAFDPQTDLKTAIADIVRLYQAKRAFSAFQTARVTLYISPVLTVGGLG